MGNSLLTGAGFPMCGEYDLKTCVAMMIMDRLDIGGSFAEFHPVDFRARQRAGRTRRAAPHQHRRQQARDPLPQKNTTANPAPGQAWNSRSRRDPSPCSASGSGADGKFKFVIAEGLSVKHAIPPTGNTNTHGVFAPDVRTFLKRWVAEGPTHHFALGVGHHAAELIEIAKVLNLDYVQVA